MHKQMNRLDDILTRPYTPESLNTLPLWLQIGIIVTPVLASKYFTVRGRWPLERSAKIRMTGSPLTPPRGRDDRGDHCLGQ